MFVYIIHVLSRRRELIERKHKLNSSRVKSREVRICIKYSCIKRAFLQADRQSLIVVQYEREKSELMKQVCILQISVLHLHTYTHIIGTNCCMIACFAERASDTDYRPPAKCRCRSQEELGPDGPQSNERRE